MDNPKKIALMIDCDNISFKVIEPVIKELSNYGEIIIKRAYGNWRNDNLKNWITKLTELSIKPIHQIDYTKGKNATDMAPISLKNACAVFTNVNSLANSVSDKEKDKAKPEQKNTKQIILDVFTSLSPQGEAVTFESLNRELKQKGIDYKDQGFKQFKVFLDSLDVFNLTINDKNQGFVQLKTFKAAKRMNEETLEVDDTLKQHMLSLYETMSQNNSDVLMSTFFNYLAARYNFNHKNYGFGTFKDFLDSTKLFSFIWKNQQHYLQRN